MYIYFDTATFDEIERDVKVGVLNQHTVGEKSCNRILNLDQYIIQCIKVTVEAQLGLIGGTMGLLTGFSILSGVEIIYYLLRFS